VTSTVFGIVSDPLGAASKEVVEQGPRGPQLRTAVWATPAADVRTVQGRIPIDRNLDGVEIGELVYLERRHGRLWAVGQIDAEVDPAVRVRVGQQTVRLAHDLYWSATRTSGPDWRDIEISSIALTAFPCRVAARPLTILPGALDHRRAPDRWQLDSVQRELLTRAAAAHLDRRAGGHHSPLVVHDETIAIPADFTPSGYDLDEPVAGPMRVRSAEPVAVSGRTIELIVAPAEIEALVAHDGRMVKEVFSRGAFAGTERRAARVRVNRDHDLSRTVGRGISFDPHDPAGLIGHLRIAKTALGDETLALAEEGILDASAGYLPKPGGEVWEARNRRRITKAYLGHIALTPDPAYESARVLAVRSW
jgi:HK97 family phage prohead protease